MHNKGKHRQRPHGFAGEPSRKVRKHRRAGDGQTNELVSWKIAQKYYFDPTFNGALVPGTRNVFQALDSITPFAFADELRHFSPIDSDLRVTPGGAYDVEVRLHYHTR